MFIDSVINLDLNVDVIFEESIHMVVEVLLGRHANLVQNRQMLPTIFKKFSKISQMLLFLTIS